MRNCGIAIVLPIIITAGLAAITIPQFAAYRKRAYVSDTKANLKPSRPRIFHKALSKAELRRVPFHALRHSYASLMIEQGKDLNYIKGQLGHHSITITAWTPTAIGLRMIGPPSMPWTIRFLAKW